MGHGERLPVRPGPANMTSLFILSFTETFPDFPAKKESKIWWIENQTIQSVMSPVGSGDLIRECVFISINQSTALAWAAPPPSFDYSSSFDNDV